MLRRLSLYIAECAQARRQVTRQKSVASAITSEPRGDAQLANFNQRMFVPREVIVSGQETKF
jgi:hypothetical protein